MTTTPTNHPQQSARNPTRRALVRRATALAGCLSLAACLTPPTGTPRAAATPPPDTPTTQVLSATAPAPATGPTSPDTVRNPGATTRAATGTGTDTTSPGAATGGGAATNAQVDTAGADAARGDADALARALDEGDYTALTQAVSERVAPHAGGGAYATTLVDALGARALLRVAAHLPTGTTTTWTSLLATATTSPLWDEGHRESLARDLASLVTTTGDLAEPDTLLLPLGFRRLLTADQDPLTTAIIGTQAPGTATSETPGAGDGQAPGAGGGQLGSRGARDSLVLDTRFLASLVRGVMAGETGAVAGGSRIGWVEYARLTTTAGGGYSNFPEDAPREVRARYSSYDPLAAVLTATARRPQTVLDVLAPPLPGADPSTLGPSGKNYKDRERFPWVDGSLWTWVAARTQRSGTACLEALTSAVASASTLRYRPTAPRTNPYEAQAAWLTEQAVVTLAGVDTTTWTPTARRTTAVMLANSIGDIDDIANGTAYKDSYSSFDKPLPVSWQDRHGKELTTLLQNVLTDDTALTILFGAANVFTFQRTAVSIESSELDYLQMIYRSSLGITRLGAHLYSYVYDACVTGRGEDKDEASPAAGVVLAALDQGPDLVPAPGAPWRPPATPAQAAQATQASDRFLTREQLGNEIANRLRLKTTVVLDAANLIPQDAYTLEDGRPAHDWITLGDDGMWHLDQEAALADPAGLNSWLNDIWTEQDLSRVTTWLAEKFVVGAPETWVPVLTTDPQAPARHAALVAVLTAATTLLVYNLSHTHQRRRERLRPIRRERLRRWRERHKSWYEE